MTDVVEIGYDWKGIRDDTRQERRAIGMAGDKDDMQKNVLSS